MYETAVLLPFYGILLIFVETRRQTFFGLGKGKFWGSGPRKKHSINTHAVHKMDFKQVPHEVWKFIWGALSKSPAAVVAVAAGCFFLLQLPPSFFCSLNLSSGSSAARFGCIHYKRAKG